MELPFLRDVLVIFGLSIAILYICHRFKVPTIVGFLITGILAGPHGLGLIKAVHEVESLAELGVILLLFTIGMEFSLKSLLQIKKSVLLGGSAQVLLTFLAGFTIALELGQPFGQAVFIGFLISLSSTAIVLKLIQERAEVDSPHGRTTLGILIFQDIIIVPMMLFTPLLAGAQANMGESPLILLAKGIGIILFVFVSAKWVVPQLLYQIARTRNRELFLLSIVSIGLVVAWLTSSAGLSLALGAFLAGLIISESEYSHQALGNILPFRDVFTSFFFISIGMLLDVSFFFQQPEFILLIALGVLALKTIIAGSAATLLGLPVRTAVLVALAVSQVGEFSFILSDSGVKHGLMTGDTYQMFLAVSILTMAATPFVMAASPRLADLVARWPMPKKLKYGWSPMPELTTAVKKDHVIIIGFGFNGKNLARAASVANIPYLIIETNPELVREEREKGEPIFFGDATQEAVLEHAGVDYAKVVVVAISDPASTRRIVEVIRRLNPDVYIIVRTRYIQEIEPLHNLGASEIIPEEFETSVEIFTRVMQKYLIPRSEVEKFVSEVRADGYEMLRSLSKKTITFSDFEHHLPDIDICSLRVGERSLAAGKTLADIELRKKHGVSVLAIRRDPETLHNPHGEMQLLANDVVVVVGAKESISQVANLLHDPKDK